MEGFAHLDEVLELGQVRDEQDTPARALLGHLVQV